MNKKDLEERLFLKKQEVVKLQNKLHAAKKEANEIADKIQLLDIEYDVIIPDNPFRHARSFKLSPYQGYDMTMCSELLKNHDLDDDGKAPICPKCRSLVDRFLFS